MLNKNGGRFFTELHHGLDVTNLETTPTLDIETRWDILFA